MTTPLVGFPHLLFGTRPYLATGHLVQHKFQMDCEIEPRVKQQFTRHVSVYAWRRGPVSECPLESSPVEGSDQQ
jgi:hypothetical protein